MRDVNDPSQEPLSFRHGRRHDRAESKRTMINNADDDLSLLTIGSLAGLLGRNKQTVTRLVDAGVIPVTYVDPESGERYFSRAVLLAQHRRIGELHAEALVARGETDLALPGDEPAAKSTQPATVPTPTVAAPPVIAPRPEYRGPIRPLTDSSGWSLDRTLNAAIARRNAAQMRVGAKATAETGGETPVEAEADAAEQPLAETELDEATPPKPAGRVHP